MSGEYVIIYRDVNFNIFDKIKGKCISDVK